MKEKLIASLIQVEKDARKLEQEGQDRLKQMLKEQGQRIAKDRTNRLDAANQEGKQLAAKICSESDNYVQQLKADSERRLEQMEAQFAQVRGELADRFFHKIIRTIAGE